MSSDLWPLVLTTVTVAITCLVGFSLRLFDSWKEWKRSLPPLPPLCVHEWDVCVKVVAQPVDMELTYGRAPKYAIDCIERLNTGSTSVLLTCRKCGDVKERTFNGTPNEGAES